MAKGSLHIVLLNQHIEFFDGDKGVFFLIYFCLLVLSYKSRWTNLKPRQWRENKVHK